MENLNQQSLRQAFTGLSSAHSVGGLVKKIMGLYPDLGTHQIIQVIRQATQARGPAAGDYASAEVVDEQKALQLAGEFVERLKL
jgi:hypothetical protein